GLVPMGKNKSNKVTARSGRFTSGPAAEANTFTNSVKFDTRLAHHDIAGSIAHARMLHHVGLLKKREMEAIVDGLETIGGEIAKGRFKWRSELEDVHMNIETALTER
ncbi:MAG TPA: argininosuccinate lyase, partial [Verrucomicrobiales bacterium]|nr:argininosuccinate lyase [Verrucomicrobiales bacterium]